MRNPLGIMLGIVGAAVLVAGLVLGFGPLHRGGASCGSAFHADTSAPNVQD